MRFGRLICGVFATFAISLGGASDGFPTPRLTSISISDKGSLSVSSEADSGTIDVVKNNCQAAESEPFHDTYLAFEVTNDSTELLRVRSGRVRLKIAGKNVSSSWLSPVGANEVRAKEKATIFIPIAKATAAGAKVLAGQAGSLSADAGFVNGVAELKARVKLNQRAPAKIRTLKARMVAALGDYDRCE